MLGALHKVTSSERRSQRLAARNGELAGGSKSGSSGGSGRAFRRGEKKRAERAERDPWFLVVEDEVQTDRRFTGRSFGDRTGRSAADVALSVAKKAWGGDKSQIVITVLHQRTGLRYTFDPSEWAATGSKGSKFSSKKIRQQISISVSR